jgi:molybdate transport system substrate-binding protein
MPSNRFRRSLIAAAVLGFLVLPLSASVSSAADVTVFAAASLKNALDEAAKLYQTKTGDKITIRLRRVLGAGEAD